MLKQATADQEVAKFMKHTRITILLVLSLLCTSIPLLSQTPVQAEWDEGLSLANAILTNISAYVSSTYTDTDTSGHRQAIVLSSLGNLLPTQGSSFIMLSTGIAGLVPVTSGGLNPGNERGNWFQGGRYGNPRDRVTFTLTLQVPLYMHYLYYDVQFFTVEYPEYINTQYNDKLTITVNSPSQGITSYVIDVNGGDFVLSARDAPLLGTGYNVFATDGNPGTSTNGVDWLSTNPNPTGADAGATALVGREHPVSPGEQITVTFNLEDVGDNQFDSTAFIDNLRFSGFAKTEIMARKTVQDVNGGFAEPDDILEYTITMSNIGTAAQTNNAGHEFEDVIPPNAVYIAGSVNASTGSISYDVVNNKIVWDGAIAAQSSVVLRFRVRINPSVMNGEKIINQGTVYWDSDEDHVNDKTELTDDPSVDDGIDQDGDGLTFDDDPTSITASSWEPPTVLEENFTDDTVGAKASNSYQTILWFETSKKAIRSNFEVAGIYQYLTPQSFKVKLRSTDSPQYWNYTLTAFNRSVSRWAVRFAYGNISNNADLMLQFKTSSGGSIASIKIEYIKIEGVPASSNHSVKLSYFSPGSGIWRQLSSLYPGGYLYNGWYKLRIERNDSGLLTYKLYQDVNHIEQLSTSRNDDSLGSSLANLGRVEWSSTKNPVICPIFFWDEHRIGLTTN